MFKKIFIDLFMIKFYFRGGSNNLFFVLVGFFKFFWYDMYLINEEVKKNVKKIIIKWIICLGFFVGIIFMYLY